MNYRHIYHAGNFADAFKHIILISLIQSLLRKETAFCYLETHAGIGSYNLNLDSAQKNKEFENGIKKIAVAQTQPTLIQDYLACVKKLNTNTELQIYPGSPFFAKQFLRPQDRMVLSELHSEDYQTLKHFFARDKQVAIHHQDGYQSLKAFLPPKERRGLVLIDPPYEKPTELAELPTVLANAIKRWETGMYAIWYPIKTHKQLNYFYRELEAKIKRPTLIAELCIYSENVPTELNGCGMLIINPPWQFDQQLKSLLPWLWETLSINQQGSYHVDFDQKVR